MSPRPAAKPYPDVDPQPRFPDLEAKVLAYWKERDTFRRSVESRPAGDRGANEYVFYDGPPFANGLPHYGHLLTGYVKDVVPRYETMRGRRVERRFGWDCHGLPAEMEVEKELGISGRAAITEYGIDKFNEQCRRSVMRYTGEWESYVTRMARWVDFENDYKTMDLSYMESVMWAFKQLWDKGLVYESRRVMPYSWAAETPLSNFEIRLDDAYRPRQDPAITVALALGPEHVEEGGPTHLLVWTTTPWTLPSNLAVAVGPEIDYAVVEKDGRRYAIGAATLAKYDKRLGDARKVGTVKGAELVGMRYEPLFPYFADQANAFTVLAAEFVDTEEGTGLVHMAPGFGEEDQQACEAAGIDLVVPVDEKGRFTSEVSDFAGQNVLEANSDIIKRLKQGGVLLEHVTYEHSYPHCWRTDQPIIYMAISSWYVQVTKFKDRMVELNGSIRWVPDRIKYGQFGKWLENARDWSISRNRFWGSPIPVWKSDDPAYPRVDVYGSLDEIERDFGVRPEDLHRPFIDELTRPNPDDPSGKSTMRRVPEVLDCWFESGSMPYAQVHYPFENKDWFEHHFPADFIVEYVGQTRGWFYTMMVLATALFDRHPFDNCICHGVLLDEKGRKLSKRLRNYPDPVMVFDTHGADAMRWYLMSSSCLRGNDLRIDQKGKGMAEVVRLVLSPIWNAYYFFTLYANADGVKATFRTDAQGLLDRYVLAKTRELVEGVQQSMDAYDLMGACTRVLAYLEALNNWYIRRSRHRFWREEKDADKQEAYDTLYTALTTLCRVAAPLLPFVTENVWRGLTGEESVHLTEWPDAEALPADRELVAQMDRIREACSAGLSLREAHRLRTRLPLASVTVAGAGVEAMEPYAHLLQDELNVKEVRFSGDVEAFGAFRLQVNAPVVGPKLGPDMKKVMAASKQGDWKTLDDGRVEVGGFVLEDGEFSMGLQPKEGVAAAALSTNDAVVVLDTEVTPELEREGVARDFVRLVQQARKDAGLQVTDRIALAVEADTEVRSALEEWRDYVAEQVLATELRFGAPDADMKPSDGSTAAGGVRFALRKA